VTSGILWNVIEMNPANTIDIDNISLGESITVVSLECLVVLKIIQHCRQSTQSETVTGQLLGLDIRGELEITDCFPLPLRQDEEEDRGSAHAMEMMKIIRDSVDNNTVCFCNDFVDFSHAGWMVLQWLLGNAHQSILAGHAIQLPVADQFLRGAGL
jgi:hypothetical protein